MCGAMSASGLPFTFPRTLSGIATPTNLTAVQLGDGSNRVKLDWSSVDAATGYDIQIDGVLTGSITASGTTYTTPSPQKVGTHTYAVRATRPGQSTEWSTSATVLIPILAPTNLTTTLILDSAGKGKVKLDWTPAIDATAYVITIDGVDSPAQVTGSTYTTLLLTAGTHTFTVTATATDAANGNLLTAATSIKSVAVPVSLPLDLKAVALIDFMGKTKVKLDWTAVTEATGYDIQIDGVQVSSTSATTYTSTNQDSGAHAFAVRATGTGLVSSGWTNPVYIVVVPSDYENRLWRSRQISYVSDGLYCRITDRKHFRLLSVNGDKSLALLDDGSSTPTEDIEVIGPQHVERHVPVAPTAVTNTARQVTAPGKTNVTLTWQPSPWAMLGYQVYRSNDGVTYTPLSKAGYTTFTDIDVPNGSWFYKVAGVNATGEGLLSTSVVVTTTA